jgi:hypothetical protein
MTDHTITTDRVPCPLDGCEFTTTTKSGLGPHLAAHRRHGDLTPKKRRRSRPSPRPPRPAALKPAEVADTVLDVLYPNGVPTDRVRDVAAWIEATERLVEHARTTSETGTTS